MVVVQGVLQGVAFTGVQVLREKAHFAAWKKGPENRKNAVKFPEGPRIEKNQSREAILKKTSFQYGMKFSIENENFKPRMKIQAGMKISCVGEWFFSCVRARMNFFDPRPSGLRPPLRRPLKHSMSCGFWRSSDFRFLTSNFSCFTYNWSSFAYSEKVRLAGTSMDCNPKTLQNKCFGGTSELKIGAPQKPENQPRRIQLPILGPLIKGDKNSECKLSNERSRSYRAIKQLLSAWKWVVAKLQGDKSASQSSMELYYPWISGPLPRREQFLSRKDVKDIQKLTVRSRSRGKKLPLETRLLHIIFWTDLEACKKVGLHYSNYFPHSAERTPILTLH